MNEITNSNDIVNKNLIQTKGQIIFMKQRKFKGLMDIISHNQP